jgi:hypothetical protein
MNTVSRFTVFAGLLGGLLVTPACTVAFAPSAESTASAAPALPVSVPAAGQRQFATPDEAVKALLAATQAHDKPALHEIFGPEARDLISGDQVADANEHAAFAKALTQFCRLAYQADAKVVLNVGAQDWPFPIPLVKKDGQWFFDTAAGKDEIINRRVGENELTAIGVCRTYVEAQREYASEDRDNSGVLKYAPKIKSTPGQKDGLFWEPAAGEEASPFGPLVASARAEGYGPRKAGESPQPFHGYLFRILTAQGPHAPGGRYNFIINGNMVAGFALVAHPARWGDSGVMTFIVNQQGRVYQRNLGPDTDAKVAATIEFDPDEGWAPVPPPGNP